MKTVGLATLLLTLLLGTVTCGLNDGEVYCNEAVAHLAQCCPNVDPRTIRCDVAVQGCLPDGKVGFLFLPAEIDIQPAQCIIELQCDALISKKICAWFDPVVTPPNTTPQPRPPIPCP